VPIVSVIIPNFNHAPYLKQRIDSVLNQTFQDFDITILDDCSTDNSKEVIESYRGNAKISSIVYNDQNTGSPFKQWQKGIDLVNGKWIWIAESDDWCEPNFLETLISGSTEKTCLAIAQSLVLNDDGKILWNSETDYFQKNISGSNFIKDKMILDNYGIPNVSMCIFKKSAYLNIDNEFTNYKFCGDWLFYILVALQGEVFISAKILNYFRKHDQDVSGKAYKIGLAYTEFFTLLDSLEMRKILTAAEKRNALEFKFVALLHDHRLDADVKKQLQKQFRSFIKAKYYTSLLRESSIKFLRRNFGRNKLKHQ
jgi:glycosyltransferase involved in cell wall biosynthesis